MKPISAMRRAGLAIRAGLSKMATVWRTTQGYVKGFWNTYFHGKASYHWLSHHGYCMNEVANRSINMIGAQVSSITTILQVFYRDTSGAEVMDANHKALDLLMSPNPRQGRLLFFLTLVAYLYLDGNVYVRVLLAKTGEDKGQPIAMFLLRPDRVELKRDGQTLDVIGYRYTNKRGIVENYDLQEVRHIRTFNPKDDERGFPLLGPAVAAIEQMSDASRHNRSLFKSGGRHPGFFVAPQELGDDVFQRTKEEMQEAYKEDAEAGVPGLLESGMKFEKQGQTQSELDFNVSDDRAMKKIAITAGIDPALVGDSANKTYSNFETAIKALILLTAIPLLEFLIGELNPFLFKLYNDVPRRFFKFKEEDIKALQEKAAEKYARLVAACGGPFLSPNDSRAEAGLAVDPNPAMNIIYRPFNQIPITALSDTELAAGEREAALKAFSALRNLGPAEMAALMAQALNDTGLPTGGDGFAGADVDDSFA